MWYPSNVQVIKIEKSLADIKRTIPSDPEEISHLLIEFSKNLRVLIQVYKFPVSLARDWIWIASRYRIDPSPLGEVGSTAGASLLWLESQVQTTPVDKENLLRAFRWVTANTIAILQTYLGPETFDKFLTREEIAKIESETETLQNDPASLSEQEHLAIREYISIFENVESETYLPGIGTMISTIALEADGTNLNAENARAALKYLTNKTDVIPDSLGYAGLVDDIYILERVFRELSGRSTWDALLPTFQQKWPFLENLQFGPLEKSRRLSNFTQVAAGLFLHSLEGTSDRPVLVLPQTGPTGFIFCLLITIKNLLEQGSQKDVLNTLTPGDHIFLRNSSVELRTKYLSDLEYHGESFKQIELHNSASTTIRPELLISAIKASEPHRTLSTNEQFQEWKENYGPDPLTHLLSRPPSSLTEGPAVIFLTRKNRLDRYTEEILPMGRTLGELVGVHYVTTTGRDIDTQSASGIGPMVWACSDTLVARELLDSIPVNRVSIPVLVDDAELAVELNNALSSTAQDSSALCVVAAQFEAEAIRQLSVGQTRTWWLEKKAVDLVHETKLGLVSRNLDSLTRFDTCQTLSTSASSSIHEVECPELQNIANQLDNLRLQMTQNSDISLQLTVMAASGLLKRYGGQPLWSDTLADAELDRMLLNLDYASSSLVGFVEQVDPLRSLVSEMRHQGLPDNPKPQKLRDIINGNGLDEFYILASSEAMAEQAILAIDPSDPLANGKWLSINSLRATAPVENLIVPGWMGRKIMREIRVSGFAEKIFYVLLPFEKEWELKSSQASERYTRYLRAASEKSWSKLSDELIKDIPKPSALDLADVPVDPELADPPSSEEEDAYLEDQLVDYIRRSQPQSVDGTREAIKGCLVTFEEAGLYTYLPPQGTVINVSRALRLSNTEAERATVECQVSEIDRGDLLAFAEEGTSDLLDVMADRLIEDSQSSRDTANLWRVAMRRYLGKFQFSIDDLHQQLRAAGLDRHLMTVTYWLNNESIIAPRNWQTAITIIANVTSDSELLEKLDECKKAIGLIYRARNKASQLIANQILDGQISLNEGLVRVLIDHHEVRYRLLRVQRVHAPEMISAENIHVISSLSSELDGRVVDK